MAASSSSSIPKFDVFLSYSPEDTSKIFVSNLDRWLSEKGVAYYKDDNPKERDSSFGSELRKYIEGSKVAVVVVSERYPTSVLCLRELQVILNLHDEGKLFVLVIFYQVDPSDIRKQAGGNAESFRKLSQRYSDEEVQEWKRALTKLSNISGLYSRFWSEEMKMVDLITNEISLLISDKPKSTPTGEGTVALDRHMQALYELLNLKSSNEVRLVGIWGPGGIGKTTLARFAYEKMSVDFHAHMFLDYSETNNYHQHHLTSREIQEVSQTMKRSLNVGSDVIKSTLGHRKSLLVIDCLENFKLLKKDLNDIVGRFGSGSRVILVTQEHDLLKSLGVELVYELQTLRYDEALELFSLSAFKQQNPPTNFESLSFRAVQVANFLPLSLKILGSSLQGKDEKTWEEELGKLEGDEEKTIMEVMKGSYKRANEQKGEIEERFT